MTALASAWSDRSAAILPLPSPESYVDFSATITLPDGRGKNQPYNAHSHPAQLTILQALDGDIYFAPKPFREIAIAKPVQDGGSLVTCVPLLRRVIRQRQAALLAFPSLDSAKDVWTTKIIPILQAYGGQEPESGGGSKGGAARVVTLPNGGRFLLRAAGGRGESQQASVTGDALCIDEVDDWPDLHRVKLIGHRLEETADPLLMLVCTVKRPEGSLILAAVEEGTNSRLHYACPDCGAYQPLEWESVTYIRVDQACTGGSARYTCVKCDCMWNEAGRKAALGKWLVVHRGQSIVDGAVTGPIPDTPRFSLRWSRLESPRKSLHSLCAEHATAKWYVEAKNDHGYMRSFFQDYLTRPYIGDRIVDDGTPTRITRTYLGARSLASDYGPPKGNKQEGGDSFHLTECPAGVEFLTCAVDVQRGGQRAPGRLYFLVTGWNGTDGRSWDIGWGNVALCPMGQQPTTGELHTGLDRFHGLLTGWAAEWARPLSRRGIDVGDRQDEIRDWLVKHRDWMPVKGLSAAMKADMAQSQRFDIAGWIYRRQQQEPSGKWWLYLIDTDTCRREAQSSFLVGAGKPGSAHIPMGLSAQDTLCQHYCATAEIPDGRGGIRWSDRQTDRKAHEDYQSRHDYLDCRVYNTAMAKEAIRDIQRKKSQEEAFATPQQKPADIGWVDQYTTDSGWLS